MGEEGGRPLSFWEATGPRLAHYLQVAITEALDWTEAPLSATDLYWMFGEDYPISMLSYHLRRLAAEKVKAIAVVHREQRRGRERKWYFLRGREWEASAAGFRLTA